MNEIEKLGQTINNRIFKVLNANAELPPEIGSITDNLGLSVKSVKNTIGREDYLVEAQANLKSGDRVLAVWCGMEPVIVAVLREGEESPIDPDAPSKLINVLSKVYPVGTLAMTSSSENPAETLGGTWAESGDVFLMDGEGQASRELYTWEKKTLNDKVNVDMQKSDVNAVLAKTYPVGCVYISISETNPSVLFGGTWKGNEDVFILTADGKATRKLYTWEKIADTVNVESSESIEAVVLLLWPVGSIYISSLETNPGGLIGGKWVESGDIFVLSADGKATRPLHTWERTE